MKIHPLFSRISPSRVFARGILAAALLTLPPMAHAVVWQGADGEGGDGFWIGANFDSSSLPGSATPVVFDGNNPEGAAPAFVTIGTGVAARARSVTFQNAKNVTISLQNGSSLTVGSGYDSSNAFNVGGVPGSTVTEPGTFTVRLEGPESGSAQLNVARLYMAGNQLNVGTSHRKTLVLAGENLTTTMSTSFIDLSGRSSLIITEGTTLLSNPSNGAKDNTNGPGAFYIRTGKEGNIYDNHLSILDGTVEAFTIRVESLLQLAEAGVLRTSREAATNGLSIVVRRPNGTSPAGRFEAAGSGLGADVVTDVQAYGTFAVGLSDPDTALRSEAAEFTLNSTLKFQSNSILEFGLFADGVSDKIVIGETGLLENLGTGAQIVLKLHGGFAVEAGQEWQLFEIDPLNTGAITGSFNLSGFDPLLWDLSRFNAEDGWVIAAIPEPGTVGLLITSTFLFGLWRLRRRRIA